MTLSPKGAEHIVLLPQDREIMEITGLSESEYREFVREIKRHSKIQPGTIVNIGVDVLILYLVIGAALSYGATLLMPKPKTPQQANVTTNTVQGQNIVNGARYTPKAGFDSVQNVVELGSVVPIVYANRQTIDGVSYGGFRVNTNLLWSQIYSVGGGQLLRAMFLVSEGSVAELDPTQFAIGNNLINNYDLAITDHGRISIYYRPDGGRLTADDHIAVLIFASSAPRLIRRHLGYTASSATTSASRSIRCSDPASSCSQVAATKSVALTIGKPKLSVPSRMSLLLVVQGLLALKASQLST
jgi:hypothetical protein